MQTIPRPALLSLAALSLVVAQPLAVAHADDGRWQLRDAAAPARVEALFEELLAEDLEAKFAACGTCGAAEGATEGEQPEGEGKGDGYCAECALIEKSSARRRMVELLSNEPGAFKVVGPLVREAFGQGGATDVERTRVLTTLAWVPTEAAFSLAHRLWKEHARDFDASHVLAFAENGSKAFVAEIEAVVAQGKAAQLGWDVRPAAFLAFRDVDVGAQDLTRAVEAREITRANVADVLIAAAALEHLGREGVRRHARIRVHDACIAALDAGRLDDARSLALAAEFYGQGVRAGVRTSLLTLQAKQHERAEAKRLASAEDVFALVERVTPL